MDLEALIRRAGPLPPARVVHILRQVCESLADGRTDLYAVGCLAYWLLTGRVVFPRDTVMEVLAVHRTEAPPAPSRLSPTTVPADLERVILACLEKSPARRPSSAFALAADLASIAQAMPWSPTEAAKAWRD